MTLARELSKRHSAILKTTNEKILGEVAIAASVAEMRLIDGDNIVDNPVVALSTNSGLVLYYWHDSSTDTDDGDLVVKLTNTTTGRLKRHYPTNSQSVDINSQSGTSYTPVLADAGKIVEMSNASANTLTIPLNSSVAFATGTFFDIVQMGAGLTSVAATGGVTIRGNLDCQGQYYAMTIYKRNTDEWVLIGGV